MQISVKGKGIEVSDPMRSYAEKKVSKVDKFFEHGAVEADVTMSTERGIHSVDLTVKVNGLLMRGEENSDDMYAAIDGAVDKVERQVRKFKTRINRRLHSGAGEIRLSEAMLGAPDEEPAPEGQIVRTKRFAIKPMSVEEAAMQMDLLGHDFYVFANSETDEVNVIYRRKDGNYGLIEPEF